MLTKEATIAQTNLPRLKMSYEEFLAWAGEDTHAEWVNGGEQIEQIRLMLRTGAADQAA